MALQDLTPRLRMRMTRAERVVGLFVLLAGGLLLAGLVSIVLANAERRGWFVNKVPYYCYTRDALGLKVGDAVRLLGRDVGRIVEIQTTAPDQWFVDNHYNVFVKFEIRQPYYGYIWTDSRVKVISADLFGSRYLEVTRGTEGLATVFEKPRFEDSRLYYEQTPQDPIPLRAVRRGAWAPDDEPERTNSPPRSGKVPPGVWLLVDETPAVAQKAEEIVRTLADALPGITNQLGLVLTQTAAATSNANVVIAALQPTLTHVEALTARLQTEEGAVGQLLLTSNLQTQVAGTLASMDATLTNTTVLLRAGEAQLQDLTRRIALTLDNVALVTSNLSAQVSANGLMLGEVSSLVVSADDMVQGLKRHWLLRSAFAGRTNPPVESILVPSLDTSLR